MVVLLVLSLTPRLALATDAAPDEPLLLEVEVNGHSINKIGEFVLRHGKLLAKGQELHDLGFRIPSRPSSEPDGLIALSSLPGVTWHLDQNTQILSVKVADSGLLPTRLQPTEKPEPVDHRVIESATGFTLNYDVVGAFAGGQAGATSALDLRGFSPRGVASSGLLVYSGTSQGGSGKNTAVRLDSAYSFADINTLRRYSLGDFITGGLGWTRPVRIGGIQIRSDFSMRPDLVTFPLPIVSGSAAVPSTIDVLVNGNSTLSGQVTAGPFEIPQLPVVSGAGTISMTMTNALGQQVNVTQPFYASSSLLTPGLQTFSMQAGLVRRNWGAISNDYGKFAGTGTYRRGLTRKFTVEGSAEGTSGTLMAGVGGVAQVGNLGVVNFATATSFGSAQPSAQISAGAQRIGRVFSLGVSGSIAGRNFRDVAAVNGEPVPRKQFSANTGFSLKRLGSVGIAYVSIDRDSAPEPGTVFIVPPQHSRIFSASYSVQVRRMSIYATEFRDLDNKSTGGLQAGVSISFGRRGSASVSVSSGGYGQVQVQQSAPQVGDWGYQAYMSAGDSQHAFGQAQYKSPWGLLSAGVDRNAGQTTVRAETQGALSVADGALFASNTIYDSFAIVNTGGMPHVHVLQENREVGRTGSSGRLLVPDMRAFDLNHITIAPTDIPPDSTIDESAREVRPQDRSGVVIRFPVKVSHGALLRMTNEAGVPLPVGSTAKLRATGALFPVGYDGEAYIQDLELKNVVDVDLPDGKHCSVTFGYTPAPGDIPKIGPLRCQEQKP